MAISGGAVWISPGQWGSAAIFAFLAACVGGLVVTRARRADVTLGFLGCWVLLVFGRSLWLGEPMPIPLHRLQNGSLLIFAFFMISDPRTTPDSRQGRLIFAAIVALLGWWLQFHLFISTGLLWSLAGCSLLTPLLDRWFPAARHRWNSRSSEGQAP